MVNVLATLTTNFIESEFDSLHQELASTGHNDLLNAWDWKRLIGFPNMLDRTMVKILQNYQLELMLVHQPRSH